MSEKERWILVTGASRGIGKAIALGAARDGFSVALHCRSSVDKTELIADDIRSLGVGARTLAFDVGDREQTSSVLLKDIDAHGAYYGVVSNAGITRDMAFPAMSGQDWDEVLRTNLDGFYNVLNPLIMPMIRGRCGGRIIALSSVTGITGNRGQTNYAAAKAGIIGAAKSLAVELAKRKITVNCVAPGVIDTEMSESVPKDWVQQWVPLRRAGLPEEVAATVCFLLSNEASYITRQVITVDGGLS